MSATTAPPVTAQGPVPTPDADKAAGRWDPRALLAMPPGGGDQPGTATALTAAYLDARAQARAAGADPGQLAGLRLAWRVLADPGYRACWDTWADRDVLDRAGLLDDGLEPEQFPVGHPLRPAARAALARPADPAGLTAAAALVTPLTKVVDNLAAALADRSPASARLRPVVLVTTGAYAPPHEGHLAMLAAARAALTRRGYAVLAGVLSPAHDSYVSTKAHRADRYPGADRVAMCRTVTAASDWLDVDPWQALHTPTELNFTDVVTRLAGLVHAATRALTVGRFDPVQVVYVFGQDNAGFARAFAPGSVCVCIPRAGCAYPGELARVAADPLPGVDLVVPDAADLARAAAAPHASSGAVRRGQHPLLPPLSPEPGPAAPAGPGVYAVRDDLGWATTPWRRRAQDSAGAGGTLRRAVDCFRADLLAALSDALPAGASGVHLVPLGPQHAYAQALRRRQRVLSLDVVVAGDAQLALTRQFRLDGRQDQAGPLRARDGAPPLAAQLATLPPGGYLLLDDDVATGSTVRAVTRALPAGVHLTGVRTLLGAALPATADGARPPVLDVVDARDFLLGARHGGLSVTLPGAGPTLSGGSAHAAPGAQAPTPAEALTPLARAPYLLPYVNLRSRASLPPDTHVTFSRRVWRANARFFTALAAAGCALAVADTDPAAARLLTRLGYRANDPLVAVCADHVRLLG